MSYLLRKGTMIQFLDASHLELRTENQSPAKPNFLHYNQCQRNAKHVEEPETPLIDKH